MDQYGKVVDPLRAAGHAGLGAAIAAVPIAEGPGAILANAARFSGANAALGSAGEVLNTGKVTAEQAGSSALVGAGMGALTGLFSKSTKAAETKVPPELEKEIPGFTDAVDPDNPPSGSPPGGPSITPRPENTALPPVSEQALPELQPMSLLAIDPNVLDNTLQPPPPIEANDASFQPFVHGSPKPRVGDVVPQFASDVDRALYIIGNRDSLSAADDKFLAFARKSMPGLTDEQLYQLGKSIGKDTVVPAALAGGKVNIPKTFADRAQEMFGNQIELPKLGPDLPEITPGVDYTPLGDYLKYQEAQQAQDIFNTPPEQRPVATEAPQTTEPTQTTPQPQTSPVGPQLGADGHYLLDTITPPTDSQGQPILTPFKNRTAANRAINNLNLNRDTVIPYQTGPKQWQLHYNGEHPTDVTPGNVPAQPPAAPIEGGPVSPGTPEAPTGEPPIVGGPGPGPTATDLAKVNLNKANNGFRILPHTDQAVQALPASVRDPLVQAVQANQAAHASESGGHTVAYPYRGSRTSNAVSAEMSPFNFVQNTKTGEVGVHGVNNEGQFVNHYIDAHDTKGSGIQPGGVVTKVEGKEANYYGSHGKQGRSAPVHTDVAEAARVNIKGIKDLLPPDHPGYKEAQRLENIMSKPIKDWGAARASLERLAKNGGLEDFQKAMEDTAGPC